MASGKCHNPWLEKIRLFAETKPEVSGLKPMQLSCAYFVEKSIICFDFPCYFLPNHNSSLVEG